MWRFQLFPLLIVRGGVAISMMTGKVTGVSSSGLVSLLISL